MEAGWSWRGAIGAARISAPVSISLAMACAGRMPPAAIVAAGAGWRTLAGARLADFAVFAMAAVSFRRLATGVIEHGDAAVGGSRRHVPPQAPLAAFLDCHVGGGNQTCGRTQACSSLCAGHVGQRRRSADQGPLSRLPLAQAFAAIAERLGDVDTANRIDIVQVGEGAGDPQDAVEAARRQFE